MWWYYFFPDEKPDDELSIRGIAGYIINVKDIAKAKAFYCHTLGFEAFEQKDNQLSLRIGDWTEITLMQPEPATSVVPQHIVLPWPKTILRSP